jgi:Ca2+/Na+ antiporter
MYCGQFRLALKVTTGISLLWSALLLWTAYSGPGVFGHDSGTIAGTFFLLFAIVLGWTIRYDQKKKEFDGRRRGLSIRITVAFGTLIIFLLLRQFYAEPKFNMVSILVAAACFLAFLWLSLSRVLRSMEFSAALSTQTTEP